jgi:hypothetical protein
VSRMTYRVDDVFTMCRKKLLITFRNAGERNGWLIENDRKLARVTLPHGRRDLKKGTLGSVIRQLGADRPFFQGLMDCPKTREDLVRRLLGES